MSEVRDRLSERVSASRLKLEARRSVRGLIVLIGGFVVAAFGLSYLLSNVASTLIKSSRTVKFQVANADGVRGKLDEIRVKGIPAGRITNVKLEHGIPVVTAQIEKKYGPVYKDAQAELRPSSALEDMYIDVVDRGTKAAGEVSPNTPLPESQTDTATNVNDVLSTFDGSTRDRLRVLLDNLGNGLNDHGAQLRESFAEAIPLLRIAGKISDQLAVRKTQTARLVHNTSELTAELANRETQLRTLIDSGAATLSTTEAGRGDLDQTLRELPPTLNAVNTSFAATRAVLGDVDKAVTDLYPVADKLGISLAALRRVSDSADPAVKALKTPVGKLVPLAKTLVPLSSALKSTVNTLSPQTHTIDQTTKDLVACEKGIAGFFHYDASMTKFGDVRGIVPRGNLVFGAQSAGLANADEYAPQACTDGKAIAGRPPQASDKH